MKSNFAIFTFLLFTFIACNNQQSTTETTNQTSPSEQMKTAYRGMVKAFESGDTGNLGDFVAENSIDHGDPVPGITSTGLQRIKDMIAMYHTSFSNVNMKYHHVVADGDLLIAHGSWTGTHTGDFMGIPATNNTIANVEYIDIIRFENGKAAEHWEVSDNLGMMTQLGVIPQEGPAPAPVQHPSFDWNSKVQSDPAKTAAMKETYLKLMDMIQKGDLNDLDQYLAADFKENMQMPGIALPEGIEGARQAMTMWKQVYPDLKVTVERLAAEGNILIAHFTMDGTYSGAFPGLPQEAAGKKVSYQSVDIIRFNEDGKAAEHWEVSDRYTELTQLGIIPAPDGQAAAN